MYLEPQGRFGASCDLLRHKTLGGPQRVMVSVATSTVTKVKNTV